MTIEIKFFYGTLTRVEIEALRALLETSEKELTLDHELSKPCVDSFKMPEINPNFEMPEWDTDALTADEQATLDRLTGESPKTAPELLGDAVRSAGLQDLDSQGFPWCAEIHATTKAKNQDGSWKKRRGVEKDVIARVEAQLRAAMGAVPHLAAVPPTQPITPPITPTQPAAPAAPTTYAELLPWIMELSKQGVWDQTKLNNVLTTMGIDGMAALQYRADLIPMFTTLIQG